MCTGLTFFLLNSRSYQNTHVSLAGTASYWSLPVPLLPLPSLPLPSPSFLLSPQSKLLSQFHFCFSKQEMPCHGSSFFLVICSPFIWRRRWAPTSYLPKLTVFPSHPSTLGPRLQGEIASRECGFLFSCPAVGAGDTLQWPWQWLLPISPRTPHTYCCPVIIMATATTCLFFQQCKLLSQFPFSFFAAVTTHFPLPK